MTNKNDNAFPAKFGDETYNSGMTIREYFAALAMQGNLASCVEVFPNAENIAKRSVEYADALIEELNNKGAA